MPTPGPAAAPLKRPRRVCIAPTDVASYYSGLRDGLAEHGVECWFFCFDYTPYTRYRPLPSAPWLERTVYHVASSPALAASAIGRAISKSLLFVLRLVCCVVAAFCCDVFVFGFGRTFLRRVELPLLRLLGRRLIFVFNGSDTRPAWMSGLHLLGTGLPNAAALEKETRRQQACIRRVERYANEIVCHPLSAQLLTRPFVNHLAIGHPFEPGATSPVKTGSFPSRLKVLHAPTRPMQKGSPRFSAEIHRLRAAGVALDYEELTNRPNREILDAIVASDLVLDELYSDIPLAGLGTETAALGRPFVVGGYGRAELERFGGDNPPPMAHYVHPDQLDSALDALVADPESRASLAASLQTFALEQWNPREMSARFMHLLTGEVPPHWRIDPRTLRYWQGWGAPEDAVRRGIAALIAHAGPDALGIAHNPELQTEVIRQAALARPAPTP
jgi:hypothetical protein